MSKRKREESPKRSSESKKKFKDSEENKELVDPEIYKKIDEEFQEAKQDSVEDADDEINKDEEGQDEEGEPQEPLSKSKKKFKNSEESKESVDPKIYERTDEEFQEAEEDLVEDADDEVDKDEEQDSGTRFILPKGVEYPGVDNLDPNLRLLSEKELRESDRLEKIEKKEKKWRRARVADKQFVGEIISGDVAFLQNHAEEIKEFSLKKFYVIIKQVKNPDSVQYLKGLRRQVFDEVVKSKDVERIRDFFQLREIELNIAEESQQNMAAFLDMIRSGDPDFAAVIKNNHLEVFDHVLKCLNEEQYPAIIEKIAKMDFSAMPVVHSAATAVPVYDVLLIRRLIILTPDSKFYDKELANLRTHELEAFKIAADVLDKIREAEEKGEDEKKDEDVSIPSNETEEEYDIRQNRIQQGYVEKYQREQLRISNMIKDVAVNRKLLGLLFNLLSPIFTTPSPSVADPSLTKKFVDDKQKKH